MSLIERYYKKHVRPSLFEVSQYDAEIAHEYGMSQMVRLQTSPTMLKLARLMLVHYDPILQTNVFGLRFDNPLGLAAGFDKYCQVYWGAVPAFGFGFVEVGGITPLEQVGHPRPRMLRAANGKQAIWNMMGFNNPGRQKAREALATNPPCPIPILANVGKGKDTPLEKAADDYTAVVQKLWPYVAAFTINVSSPNTKLLRELQSVKYLVSLFKAVQSTNELIARLYRRLPKPVGIKISPDEKDEQLADILYAAQQCGVSYLVETNTSMERPETLNGSGFPVDRGGVSGDGVRARAREVLIQSAKILKHEIPIISVGGIGDGNEAYDRIVNGASLIQSLTALPYEGPDFAKRLLKQLAFRLRSDGFSSVSHAVGFRLH